MGDRGGDAEGQGISVPCEVAGLEAPEIFTASGISPEWQMSDPHLFFSFFFVW